MKIVHVCLCCGAWYENYAYQDQLLPHYHKLGGHKVTIITGPYTLDNEDNSKMVKDNTYERELKDGVKLIRLKALLPGILNRHLYLFKELFKALRNEKPDLIFAHGVESLNYLAFVKYKKHDPNVHIVCDNHTDLHNSYHHWSTRLWSKFITRDIVVKKLIPVVDWFYGVTPVRNDFLVNYYRVPKEKVKLLLMGADDKQMHWEERDDIRNRTRKENGIDKDDFLIVTGGRITPYKVDTMFKFVKAIADYNEEKVKLLLFGSIDKHAKPLFEKISSSRIILTGWVQSDRVYDYFYAADLVAFPGLHSVLWEQAVASRVPCAFNHLSGFDHVNFNNNCIWLEEDNEDYYQRIIKSLFPISERYMDLLNNARNPQADMFLYSGIAKQVVDDIKQR